VEAAQALMDASLGSSMCGTAHLHDKYCTHPCCISGRQQQAAGASPGPPPATPSAAGGQRSGHGEQEQHERRGQQQGSLQQQQRPVQRLGLVIDGLNKVSVCVCAYPGCGRQPKGGKRAMWCEEHEELCAHGCRAAVQKEGLQGEGGGALVLPCCAPTLQAAQFCQQHADLRALCQRKGGGSMWG
jgi:hypothetical protein